MAIRSNPTVLELEMVGIMSQAVRQDCEDEWAYYLDDKLRLLVAVRNRIPNGSFKLFYENGELALEGEFLRGQRNGQTNYYRPDGSPWELS